MSAVWVVYYVDTRDVRVDVHGVFRTEEEARALADGEGDGRSWWVLRIPPPAICGHKAAASLTCVMPPGHSGWHATSPDGRTGTWSG